MQALSRCPPRFRDAEHGKAWLLAVTRNVCMDLHRERRRDRKVIAENEPPSELHVDAQDPEAAYLAREHAQRVRSALARLPRRLRRTAELRVLSEMRYGDIARELGISPANVRKRMQDVRDLLRDTSRDVAATSRDPAAAEHVPSRTERSLCCVLVRTADGIEHDVELVIGLRVRRRDARRFGTLEHYIARHPRGWRKRLELARMLAIEGRWSEAVAYYFAVVAKHPFAELPWTELGVILRALGRCAEAGRLYERAAAAVGRDAHCLHFRAMAACARDERERARELFSAAIDASPDHAPSLRALGTLQLAAGRPHDAAAALRRSLDADPGDPLAPILLSDALLAGGLPVAARALIERVAASDDTNVLALERLIAMRARARLVDGDEGHRSDALLTRLTRLAPDRAGSAVAAARLSFARGRRGTPRDPIASYLRGHPRHVTAWVALAELRLANGDVRGALRALGVASRLDPDRRDIWMVRCHALRCAERGDEAQRALDLVRKRFRGDALLLAAAAGLAASIDASELACELLRSAVALQPHTVRIRRQFAALLLRADRLEDAKAEIDAASERLPPDDAHADAVALALLDVELHRARGDPANARESLMVAWERTEGLAMVDPAFAQARRGAILDGLGMFREAAGAYRSALAQHVAFPLRGEIERLLARRESELLKSRKP